MVDEHLPLWTILLLSPVLAAVAAAYAAVGLGGGSGYVAVMALMGLPAAQAASTALVLNLVVTLAALVRYGLAGRLRWGLILPFLVPAIPAAVVGGFCKLPRHTALSVLAVALVAAAVATFRTTRKEPDEVRRPALLTRLLVGLPSGLVVGFVSGLVGLGGGVFLGPAILLLRWGNPKEVAGMNAVTILVLSAAGLIGHGMGGSFSPSLVLPFALATLVGGMLGAHLGERKLSPTTLRRLLAILVLIAGLKAAIDALRGWFT
jgi:uncharacterized membrane protein YfcA